MADLIRESSIGQVVRLITRNKLLRYPEEEPGFQIPWQAKDLATVPEEKLAPATPDTPDDDVHDKDLEKNVERDTELDNLARRATTRRSSGPGLQASLTRTRTREQTVPYSAERFQTEQEEAIDREQSTVIVPQKTADGITLVDWYTTDDPANPQNWSTMKKAYIGLVIFLYTFAVYAGSSIYTSAEPFVMEVFGVGYSKAALGLSMYVIGYGVGPLLFSPLSEIPHFGRNVPYIASMALFVILCVPTALVDNYAGLLVLRFLTGFFGSPCLASVETPSPQKNTS